MKNFCKLSLFVVAVEQPATAESIEALEQFLTEQLGRNFELEVIDILRDSQRALQEGILATPTLVRGVPPPPLRVVGDFTNREKVLAALELGD